MAVVRGHQRELDGIRGIFVLIVMAYHFRTGWFPGGALSVDLFFVLSGYLITGLLIREREITGRIGLRDFYLRRVFRLVPALLMLLVVGGGIAHLAFGTPAHNLVLGGLVAGFYLTDVVSYTHATVWATYVWIWTLAIEEHFYLIWPALLLRVGRSRQQMRWLVYTLAVASLVLGELTAYGGRPGVAPRDYYQPQEHAFCIMLGCAVALTTAPRWFRHVAAPALAAMVVLTIVSPDQTHVIFLRISVPAEAIATAVLLLALEQKPRFTPRLLTLRPLCRIGVISYSLYLYHPLIYPALGTRIHSHPVLVAVAYATTIAAAELSYRFYEAPIRRWGRARFDAESPKAAAPV